MERPSNLQQTADISKIKEPLPPKVDRKAEQEEHNLISEARRDNRMKNAKHWGTYIFIWFCICIIIVIIFCRIWHIILPHRFYWLEKEDLGRIDEFFVDGSIGGLIVGFFKEVVFGDKN